MFAAENQIFFRENGVLDTLMKLLESSTEHVRASAATAVWHICLRNGRRLNAMRIGSQPQLMCASASNQEYFCSKGYREKLSELLQSQDDSVQVGLLALIKALCMQSRKLDLSET